MKFMLRHVPLLLLACAFSSCVLLNPEKANNELVYFKDLDSLNHLASTGALESRIRVKDLLYIGVRSFYNDSVANKFNQFNYYAGSNTINTTNASLLGYMVDEEGYVDLPSFGRIKVVGMTKRELGRFMEEKLKAEMIDPVVTIRFLNFRVTVLGEVARPNSIDVTDEHITLLEAIGLCGDLTPYARRDHILVVRDDNGKKSYGRVDLNSGTLLNSPFYYLKQDDVVYVEPGKRKLPNADQTVIRNISILTSVLSSIALIYTLILK